MTTQMDREYHLPRKKFSGTSSAARSAPFAAEAAPSGLKARLQTDHLQMDREIHYKS